MLILGMETSCDETGVALYDTERGLLARIELGSGCIGAQGKPGCGVNSRSPVELDERDAGSTVELDEPGRRRESRFPLENRDVVEGQSCRNLG